MDERLGIAGSGAIATGLAASAARLGDVVLVARSDASADRARAAVEKLCSRMEDADPARVQIGTDLAALAETTAVVEAIAEDLAAKTELWAALRPHLRDGALVASTTSSLSVADIAAATGAPERFVGLHVFNPVPRMKLVELAYPAQATQETRDRAKALVEALDKTPVEVPDIAGFVVNRLLFPYLFSAVFLQEETGLSAEAIDTCMQLGAGHPMGPLALLDFVGLDVSLAIGEAVGTDIPQTVRDLVGSGDLGKKTGKGFYTY